MDIKVKNTNQLELSDVTVMNDEKSNPNGNLVEIHKLINVKRWLVPCSFYAFTGKWYRRKVVFYFKAAAFIDDTHIYNMI